MDNEDNIKKSKRRRRIRMAVVQILTAITIMAGIQFNEAMISAIVSVVIEIFGIMDYIVAKRNEKKLEKSNKV